MPQPERRTFISGQLRLLCSQCRRLFRLAGADVSFGEMVPDGVQHLSTVGWRLRCSDSRGTLQYFDRLRILAAPQAHYA